MPTNPPAGYNTITPYAVVEDPDWVIAFARDAFGATLDSRMERPDGGLFHAELRLGDSMLMVGGANAENSPFPAMLHVYVDDVDAAYASALEAGAKSLREPEDQFYGDRMAGVVDPQGNQWWLATHIEEVSEEEMTRRMEAMTA